MLLMVAQTRSTEAVTASNIGEPCRLKPATAAAPTSPNATAGPVVSLQTFDDDDACDKVNASDFGLVAGLAGR